ncbi:Laccase-3 [Hibiscus syriacus]|uniref:Laccase-3 n=1 Tax=Hibiscus syriacus TaxID=106335 RepID=A0A6A2YAA5_HIBSY|nr:Laccase-3 [Hibiscus syriacus]
MDVLRLTLFTGAAANVSDALTINVQPGDLYRCSSKGMFSHIVAHQFLRQKLRYFPWRWTFATNVIMIAPGQTSDVLLTADQTPACYYMAAHVYNSANSPFDNTTTTAILEYKSAPCSAKKGQSLKLIFPQLSGFNDTATLIAFTSQLRSFSKAKVPLEIDESLFFTVGLGLINCTNPNSPRCQGPNGTRFAASINNVSFVLPRMNSLMQAYYQGQPNIFTTNFPPFPPLQFDYSVEDHPMHLHGYQFYVVENGFGNFDPKNDPAKFNRIDPPERNTIGTPPGGWVAIRFEADNPDKMPNINNSIWLLHCHLDSHLPWGLATAFLVENGVGKLQTVQPPPLDLP